MGRIRGAQRWLRAASIIAALFAGATCSDQPPVSPRSPLAPGHSRFSIAPRYQKTATGGPIVPLSKIRGILVGTNGDSVVVTADFVGDSAVLTFDVQFTGTSAHYTLKLTGYDKDGKEAYSGTQDITLRPGENSDVPQPVLVYSAVDATLQTLHVTPGSLQLDAGKSAGLSVSGTGSNGAPIAPIRVAWASRNSGIATVDDNGTVLAGQSQGSTYIVATSIAGPRDSALVKVKAPVAKVVVTPATLQLIRGKSGAAAAELRDAGDHLIDDRTATWASSDPSVASVNASGAIQAVKIGTVTITASAEGKSGSVAVQVVSPIDHIEMSPASLTFASLHETHAVSATLVARAGGSTDGIAITYSSSNPSVASVDAGGAATANQNGSATITASAEGFTASAAVTVKQVAASISVSPKSAILDAIGNGTSFSATLKDALGNDMSGSSVTWSSSNPGVATVNGGAVIARGSGSTTITASADGKSDAATVTVSQAPRGIVASIDQNPLIVGGAPGVLTARTIDANGNVIGVVPATWTTTTPNLVSISGNRITALANGVGRATATTSGFTATVGFAVTGGAIDTLSITPSSAEKLPNGTQQFSVTSGGTGPFTWTVNGVAGGNGTFGTVSGTGFYTAPAAVPTPSSFDVCAVQASPANHGCARVTINPVPSAGGEVVVFNDMNLFDNSTGSATGGANQRRFFINLINFTASGPRATKTGFEFFRGHQSRCVNDGECTTTTNSIMSQTLRDSGYTVVDENDPNATIPSTIDPSVKVILLLTPTLPFSDTELNSLKQFASEGGRIIFAGEHSGFYGTWITSVENPFFQAMGAQLTNLQVAVNCSPWLVGQSSLRTHQITAGLTDLAVPCAAGIQLGPNDFAIVYDNTGTTIIGAVAKVDLTPISIHTTSVRGRNALRKPTVDAVPPKPTVNGVGRPIPPT